MTVPWEIVASPADKSVWFFLFYFKAAGLLKYVLTFAGSDSMGGAEIQTDIKTVTALGGHVFTAINNATDQNGLATKAAGCYNRRLFPLKSVENGFYHEENPVLI